MLATTVAAAPPSPFRFAALRRAHAAAMARVRGEVVVALRVAVQSVLDRHSAQGLLCGDTICGVERLEVASPLLQVTYRWAGNAFPGDEIRVVCSLTGLFSAERHNWGTAPGDEALADFGYYLSTKGGIPGEFVYVHASMYRASPNPETEMPYWASRAVLAAIHALQGDASHDVAALSAVKLLGWLEPGRTPREEHHPVVDAGLAALSAPKLDRTSGAVRVAVEQAKRWVPRRTLVGCLVKSCVGGGSADGGHESGQEGADDDTALLRALLGDARFHGGHRCASAGWRLMGVAAGAVVRFL